MEQIYVLPQDLALQRIDVGLFIEYVQPCCQYVHFQDPARFLQLTDLIVTRTEFREQLAPFCQLLPPQQDGEELVPRARQNVAYLVLVVEQRVALGFTKCCVGVVISAELEYCL